MSISSAEDQFKDNLTIREMVVGDILQIMAMEEELFSSPWSREMFLQEVHTQHAYVLLKTDDNLLIGYICGWLMLDEFNITNIAIRTDYQKIGLGGMLVKFIMGKLLQQKCFQFLLEVRESNIAAIKLYAKLNFEIIGKRKKYYNHPTEDALIMKLDMWGCVNNEDGFIR
jgi:[ribosomal protein S18]-alanine N-acetyltransferase